MEPCISQHLAWRDRLGSKAPWSCCGQNHKRFPEPSQTKGYVHAAVKPIGLQPFRFTAPQGLDGIRRIYQMPLKRRYEFPTSAATS